MNTETRNQPIYVFQVTPEISLIWTIFGSLLLILAAAGASWYYAIIHGQAMIFNLESEEGEFVRVIFPFLSLMAITLGTIVIHELIHGITFTIFGGSPRYGLKVKSFLPVAYATSPGDLFERNAFVVITLAPLIIIDVVCLLLLAIFPQAPWLIWVIAFNTSGAIGDIWMAVQLLRCPQSIRVEDREEGIAIYAPVSMTLQNLPFAGNDQSRAYSVAKSFLNLAFMALALVLISTFLLIPLLKILEIPTFIIGNNDFWLLRWENTTAGFGFSLNLISIIILIVTFVTLGFLVKLIQRGNRK
jgi:hypothetical protein